MSGILGRIVGSTGRRYRHAVEWDLRHDGVEVQERDRRAERETELAPRMLHCLSEMSCPTKKNACRQYSDARR